jgi:NADH:ubiquinone oxidoreductase subunit 6 (subunit J)
MLFAVYVGAVAVLFIFCLMLLNIGSEPVRTYGPAGVFFFVLLLSSVLFLIYYPPSFFMPIEQFAFDSFYVPQYPIMIYDDVSAGQILAVSLYTDFNYVIIILGFLLFSVTVFVTVLFSQIISNSSRSSD